MNTKNDALKNMLQKLDDRSFDSRGYVTYSEEVIAILKELSHLVPASVTVEPSSTYDDVNVSISIGFTISRSELDAVEADVTETWNSDPAVGEENEILDEAHCRESGLHLTDVDDNGFCNFCGHGHETSDDKN